MRYEIQPGISHYKTLSNWELWYEKWTLLSARTFSISYLLQCSILDWGLICAYMGLIILLSKSWIEWRIYHLLSQCPALSRKRNFPYNCRQCLIIYIFALFVYRSRIRHDSGMWLYRLCISGGAIGVAHLRGLISFLMHDGNNWHSVLSVTRDERSIIIYWNDESHLHILFRLTTLLCISFKYRILTTLFYIVIKSITFLILYVFHRSHSTLYFGRLGLIDFSCAIERYTFTWPKVGITICIDLSLNATQT